MPGHRIGMLSIGPVRRVWCSCGRKWRQDDVTMALDDARKAERQWIRTHLGLAALGGAQLDDSDWCRERPG